MKDFEKYKKYLSKVIDSKYFKGYAKDFFYLKEDKKFIIIVNTDRVFGGGSNGGVTYISYLDMLNYIEEMLLIRDISINTKYKHGTYKVSLYKSNELTITGTHLDRLSALLIAIIKRKEMK